MPTLQVRHYCYTLNNPGSSHTLDALRGLPNLVYAVYQLERGAEGTLHVQGYLEFARSVRISWLQQQPCIAGSHFERRRGTREQARDYCTKADSRVDGPFETGELPNQQPGRRSDILDVKDCIDSGASELEIAETHFSTWSRCFRAIERYRRLRTGTIRRDAPLVDFVYGPSGAGKSRFASELDTHERTYWKPRGLWWDGYDSGTHSTVILDDFAGNFMSYTDWKRLCDRYPLLVETKGGQVDFMGQRIVITSTKPPSEWWSDKVPVDLAEITRRISRVIHFDGIHAMPTIYHSDNTRHALEHFNLVNF